ncbi:DUF1697 domain-containing protein [Pseudaminobacter sp. 19-2017]|uniref:DUF1697 domain-containing protein n=1 Tax=Pseudaminobacter soli (ex Zhang et al. 2022) TaxID=2831468 RepID=A0A942E1Q2_9HYPH|nr:DUF1697 domain-containing protein [Pseudaminobacter soli]MBS3652224.1 DUF1697 domain-containing protein [Pseudaminobacter soli]
MSDKTVYILLFRGVGGKTQLPTAPLREALSAAGFENVATYINSGNAVVRTSLGRDEVISSVAQICRDKFGFTKAIHAPTLEEWTDLIAKNPFPHAVAVPKFLHAAVLAEGPAEESIEAVQAFAADGEGFAVIGKVAYIHTPDGFGTSKLAEKFDRLIGVENTARNWNSVLKLRDLAEKAASG